LQIPYIFRRLADRTNNPFPTPAPPMLSKSASSKAFQGRGGIYAALSFPRVSPGATFTSLLRSASLRSRLPAPPMLSKSASSKAFQGRGGIYAALSFPRVSPGATFTSLLRSASLRSCFPALPMLSKSASSKAFQGRGGIYAALSFPRVSPGATFTSLLRSVSPLSRLPASHAIEICFEQGFPGEGRYLRRPFFSPGFTRGYIQFAPPERISAFPFTCLSTSQPFCLPATMLPALVQLLTANCQLF